VLLLAGDRLRGRSRASRPTDGPSSSSRNPGLRAPCELRDADAEIRGPRRRLVGVDPVFLLLDRSGQRAYVFHRDSASITVLDVPQPIVVREVSGPDRARPVFRGPPESGRQPPLRAPGRLPLLAVLSAPDLTPVSASWWGWAPARSETGRAHRPRVRGRPVRRRARVFDPGLASCPSRGWKVPGPVTRARSTGPRTCSSPSSPPIADGWAANELVDGRPSPRWRWGTTRTSRPCTERGAEPGCGARRTTARPGRPPGRGGARARARRRRFRVVPLRAPLQPGGGDRPRTSSARRRARRGAPSARATSSRSTGRSSLGCASPWTAPTGSCWGRPPSTGQPETERRSGPGGTSPPGWPRAIRC